MKRNLKGKFSKKQHYKLPYQDNLKVILPFVYLLIIAFTGNYITEAKVFYNNYIKQIYAKRKITIYPHARSYEACREVSHQDEPSITEIPEPRKTIKRVAEEKGFIEWEKLVALAECESSLNGFAMNVNRDGSLDRGWYQFNATYHPEVSTECATDLECSTREAIRVIRERTFNEWVCNRYLDF